MHHKWLGRNIISPDHHRELEREAAIHEFGGMGLDREQAEEAAYQKYKTKHHESAAVHHLGGLRAAISAGDQKEADRHRVMYTMHMSALGHNPSMPPPQHIHMAAQEHVYSGRFSNHHGDGLLSHRPMTKAEREATGIERPLCKAERKYYLGTGDLCKAREDDFIPQDWIGTILKKHVKDGAVFFEVRWSTPHGEKHNDYVPESNVIPYGR